MRRRLYDNQFETHRSSHKRKWIRVDGSCVYLGSRNRFLLTHAPVIKPSPKCYHGSLTVLFHLLHQSTQTMSPSGNSSNPYAPKISPEFLWMEHAAFAGDNLGEIFYGAHLINH